MHAHLLSLIRLARAAAMRRLDAHGRHPSIAAPATVVRIDDPDGRGAILVVRGVLDASSLRCLWCELDQLAGVSEVHLDLTDASILRGPWMDELGVLADALEDVGCDVGIVGVNPHHPDLRPQPWQP